MSAARAGADELRGLRARFEVTDLVDPDADLGVEQAGEDFHDSAGHLGNPVLTPARFLPVIGRQIQAADALAESGSAVLDRVIQLRADLLERTGDGLPAGEQRVEFLAWLSDELDSTGQLVAGLDFGPETALVAPLDRARRTVDDNLDLMSGALDDARAASDAALAVFGQRSRYLVLAANNAEMRVGSGMFLSIGELRIEGGSLAVSEFESVENLTLEGRVDAPPEVEQLWGWANPGREWRNLGLTPDFTVNGSMAAQMWTELGNEPVDGVLMVDVPALALLLEVTGSVTGPGGTRIDSSNVEEVIFHDQYLDLDDGDANDARREQLAEVAGAVLAQLDRPGLDLGAFATAMQSAQRGRHLLAWSADERQQNGWETLGVDGAVNADDLIVGVANIDASKMDPFLRVGVDVDTRAVAADEVADGDGAGDPETEIRLSVTVANRTPPGEPLYVLGADPEATYDGIVVAYLPQWARAISAEGGEIVASGREDGNLVIGVSIAVPRGEQTTVDIVVRGPSPAAADVTLLPGARRPAVGWRHEDAKFTDRRRQSMDLHAE